jgi:HEAT repeat protein
MPPSCLEGFLSSYDASLYDASLYDTEEWVTLGEIKAFGQTDFDGRQYPERTVPIRFPVTAPVPSLKDTQPSLPWGEWKIALNEFGNLGRRYYGSGGWEEFRWLYQKAQERIRAGKSQVWKCKAYIFRRTDVLYRRVDGVLEPQRVYLSDEDLEFCLETFARFEALVEAFTEGALDVQLTFGIEEEPVTGYYEGAGVWALDPRDAGERFLKARFNTGDYDSVLYMYHPGPTRAFSFGGTAGRINRAPGAYVILSNGREGGTRIGHTEAMLHEWYHQIEGTYGIFGYGGYEYSWLPHLHSAEQNGYQPDTMGYSGWFCWMRDLMRFSVRPKMWEKLSNRREPDWDSAIRQTFPYQGKLYVWEEVKDDPWAKLPFLTPEDLAGRMGAENVRLLTGPSQVLFLPVGVRVSSPLLEEIDPDDFSLNNELNFSRESMARLTIGERDFLFIRWDVADFVLENLPDRGGGLPAPNVLGYMSVDAKLMLVVETRLNNPTDSELNLLALGSPSTILVEGRTSSTRDAYPRVLFRSAVAGMRFSVVDQEGRALNMGENGELYVPRDSVGPQLLRVIGFLPDGSRVERPFVVRLYDPVKLELRAEGTRRVTGAEHRFSLSVQNFQQPTTLHLKALLPEGWRLEGLPETLSLNPRQRVLLPLKASLSPAVREGEVELRIQGVIENYAGPPVEVSVPLLRETRPTLLHHRFETSPEGWDAPRPDNAGWTATVVEDKERGKVLCVQDAGGMRWGRVSVFKGGEMGYEVSAYPYLDFFLKTEASHTLALVVTLSTGKRCAILLAGPYGEQWGESVELPRAKFIPNGKWQRVVYDLNSALKKTLGEGPHYVVDIAFGDTRQFSSNQWQTPDRFSHYVDDFRITREANLADNTTQDDPDEEIRVGSRFDSANPEDRARACAGVSESSPEEVKAKARALLTDANLLVRLNATAVFTRVKDPKVVPVLAERIPLELDSWISVYLVRALEHQDTPEAWGAIRSCTALFRSAYQEQGMAEAAAALARRGKGDPEDIQALHLLLTARGWQTRAEGARALGILKPTETLFIVLEGDPMVRLYATLNADPNSDLMRRRLEWASVNDFSHVVRAHSYARLARASDPLVRARGYAGLRDPDPEIRRIIAESLGSDPQPYHIPELENLLKDKNPQVRASAVVSLLKMPGATTYERFSVLETEEYSEVLIPLLEASKAGRLTLPKAFLERLLRHRDQTVRNIAKEILDR